MSYLPSDSNKAVQEQLGLASAELQRRLLAGETCRSEEYLTAFPLLNSTPQAALDLLYDEYITRVRLLQRDLAEEFLQRFPSWRDSLHRQFQFHVWLGQVLTRDPTRPPSVVTPEWAEASAPAAEEAEWASCFDILHEIARGGMGVVYKAWQRNLGRVVAIKTMRHGAGTEERRRFRTEAEAMARLQHPNIVQLHEVGQRDNQPYLVLEYVEGGTLASRLAGNPLPFAAAARLVRTLARAVHHVHRNGVLHRDLSPANILLTREGVPRISDFGLAQLLPESSASGDSLDRREAELTEALIGTPGYMAPEQAGGEAVGPAADVYALGAILYKALTGRPPFRAETMAATLHQVQTKKPLRPSQLRPEIPHELESICLRCLRKEPQRRYASAEMLARKLTRFLRGAVSSPSVS